MKKLLAVLMVLVLCFSFAACGGDDGVTVDEIKNFVSDYLADYFEDDSAGEITEYEEKNTAVTFNYCDDLAWVVIGTEDGKAINISANVYFYRLGEYGFSKDEYYTMAIALAPVPAATAYSGQDPTALIEALINDDDFTVENNGWEFSLTVTDSYLGVSAKKK